MPDDPLSFLDARHPIWEAHHTLWEREERRLYGGDAVLPELTRFRGEDDDHYAARQAQAVYLPFPKLHASVLAGHLGRARPMPGQGLSFGTLGEIRERANIDRPSTAELVYYNVDGIGNDGSQFPAWTDALEERACATGFRWVLVEMPRRDANAGPVTQADVEQGHRPYGVEFSPIDVPYWEIDRGRLDWAILRTPVTRSKVIDGVWTPAPTAKGYYLLVRAGYQGLGETYAEGGWWLFDEKKNLLDGGHGTWEATRGEIPLIPFIGEPSQGTRTLPAMARSLTMELGQLAVGLMNRLSERDHDASDAAKSIKIILGADKEGFNLLVGMLEDGNLMGAVPPSVVELPDGTSQAVVPQIYDSSAGAVASTVYQTIIASDIDMAREIMVRQLSATPDSSGASKQAGFAEAQGPLLSRLAATREQFENSFIYFAELRAGATQPTGSVVWPRDFDLKSVVDDIDAMFETLRRAMLRSPTLEATLALTAARERGFLADDQMAEQVKSELEQSAEEARTAAAQQRALFSSFGLPTT